MMPCYGCEKEFRDKTGYSYGVTRSTSYSLCYDCQCKALQIYDCDPKILLKLYLNMQKNGIYIPGLLIDDQITETQALSLDPSDRMFNPRG